MASTAPPQRTAGKLCFVRHAAHELIYAIGSRFDDLGARSFGVGDCSLTHSSVSVCVFALALRRQIAMPPATRELINMAEPVGP